MAHGAIVGRLLKRSTAGAGSLFVVQPAVQRAIHSRALSPRPGNAKSEEAQSDHHSRRDVHFLLRSNSHPAAAADSDRVAIFIHV